VHAFRAAVTVFIDLDLDQSRLRASFQSRDAPGMGVGFLELVDGAVDDEFSVVRKVCFAL